MYYVALSNHIATATSGATVHYCYHLVSTTVITLFTMCSQLHGYNLQLRSCLFSTGICCRWYRAPELLCDSPYYGKEVDVWSVGCIFAEMLGRRPFLQGKSPMHQVTYTHQY